MVVMKFVETDAECPNDKSDGSEKRPSIRVSLLCIVLG